MENDKQIEELQKKMNYLENYADELNSVIIEMRKEIEKLTSRIDSLKQYVVREDSEFHPDEKPPHY